MLYLETEQLFKDNLDATVLKFKDYKKIILTKK